VKFEVELERWLADAVRGTARQTGTSPDDVAAVALRRFLAMSRVEQMAWIRAVKDRPPSRSWWQRLKSWLSGG
jgi:hypothetical protein